MLIVTTMAIIFVLLLTSTFNVMEWLLALMIADGEKIFHKYLIVKYSKVYLITSIKCFGSINVNELA